jgi:GNAT superfamily N-acetyltransferase
VWVAERDGAVVGFCQTAPIGEADAGSDSARASNTAELRTIYLAPEVVGTGVGAALIRHALGDLRARGFRAAFLWVIAGNERARRFYEKGGWRPDGVEKTEEAWGTPVHQVRYRIELLP